MISVGIGRFGLFIISIILILISLAASQDSSSSVPSWDWLGTGPIYGHTSYYSPYYNTYSYPNYGAAFPTYIYNPSPVYVNPYLNYLPYYNGPYLTFPTTGRYYTNYELSYPWWVGAHKDLSKVLEIAKTSSMKVYSNGVWQSP
jgi:hypothetical protein